MGKSGPELTSRQAASRPATLPDETSEHLGYYTQVLEGTGRQVELETQAGLGCLFGQAPSEAHSPQLFSWLPRWALCILLQGSSGLLP